MAETWNSTSPGHFSRPIDEAELFYASLARRWAATGKTFFAITGHISLSLSLSEQDSPADVEQRVETALRKAWRRLRYDHPSLAAVVEYDPTTKGYVKVYEGFGSGEGGEKKEKQWIEETFRTATIAGEGRAFWEELGVGKYATLYVIATTTTPHDEMLRRDIVLRCHHDLIDGIGTMILFDNFFGHVADAYKLQDDYEEVRFGDEFKNLSPSFRVAAGVMSAASQKQKDRFEAITAANAAARDHRDIIGIPFSSKESMPGSNRRVAIKFTGPETKTVLEKCKEMGISATQAFHTGIVLAVRDLQKKGDGERVGRYINYCLVNLRHLCAPPFSSNRHPAAVFHSASGTSLVVDVTIRAMSSPPDDAETLKKEFASVAVQIKEFYLAVRLDPDHANMVPLYYGSNIPSYPVETNVPAPNKSPSVSISSLGVIDKIIRSSPGPFTLHDPWVTADELSTGVGVFLATWRGEMCLSAGFNEAFHDEQKLVEFLNAIKRVVFIALAVPGWSNG